MVGFARAMVAAVAAASALVGAVASNEAGLAFLEANKAAEGVVTLPSGLQYKVLKRGDGSGHPTVDSTCTCHYHGTLIDGSVFDSSVERGSPIDFAPNQVIPGWTEAMQLMVEGDKWELYIPSELAYGARGSPPKIGPDEVLVFTIEILEIHGDTTPAATCDPSSLERCDEREKAYVAKQAGKAGDALRAEVARLEKMLGGKMKADLAQWIRQRVNILRRMAEAAGADGKEEL